jgi:3-isopropylmalate/(R)-2-methylmalate dehydratase small subunit
LLGGENFGTGSSRETAARVLLQLGIRLVIAKSFACIFFRNAVDIGLPVMICSELYDTTDDGNILSADLIRGEIINETKEKIFKADPLPKTMMEILKAGGLIKYAIKENW